MRIFGFEITRSKPCDLTNRTVWNTHRRGPVTLGSLTADELRSELFLVYALACNGKGYYVRTDDVKRQLHIRDIAGVALNR